MTDTTKPDISSFGPIETPRPRLDHRDMEPIRLSDVDIHHPGLTRNEAIGLSLVKDKVERYISKGRIHEAHGAAYTATIMYQALLGADNIDTGWGEL